MPTFAANLSMLFTELPLAQRFAACASAGFRYCEIQFPYEIPAPQMAALLAEHDLQLVLHNLPAGNWAAGERGIACLPERQAEFRAGVAQAIAYAQQVGVTQLNCLAGIAPSTLAPQLAHDCLLDNVRYAAQQLHANGMRLLLEPINSFDIPGFFLNKPSQALALIQLAARPNVFLQYDCYHAQRM
ncbi:MAG: TIM barrel protein, partial [Burkholderiales bacterium]|nr:TIM barrel protein [Burkholderiales bacterium]